MAFYVRILSYFRKDLTLIVALVILIWIALAVSLLLGWPLAILTDTVLAPDNGSSRGTTDFIRRAMLSLLPSGTGGKVLGVALIWLAAKLTETTINLFLRVMVNHRLRYNGTARVRALQLFDKLQQLSPSYHRSNPQGDAIYRLTTDSLGFFGVFDTFMGAANAVLTLGIALYLMVRMDARMTGLVLCLAPLLILANVLFSRTIRRTSLASKQTDATLTSVIQRGVAAVGLTQLFGRQRHEADRLYGAIDSSIRAGMRMNLQEAMYPTVVQNVYALGYATILGFGGYLVYRDQSRGIADGFAVGDIFIFINLLDRIFDPLSRITGFTAAVQVNAAACARVFQVLDLEPAVTDPLDASPLPLRPRTLALSGVSFAYAEDRPVLRRVDARIQPGQMVAFIGQSGAGKSTLLNLLPRFYDPTGGAVTLDGHDLRGVPLDDVRRHVGLVPQDSMLLPVTIGENIAYGRPGATERQVRDAAALAGAASFVEALPQGYDTLVTEAAQNLSGGQRQRLAIARALLTDAPILVLDEPTSALDPAHERHVLQTLRSLKGARTVILVTHRIESVSDCDQIYVLDNGLVVEHGSHDELLSRNGPYARMAGGPRPTPPDERPSQAAA